MTGSYTLNPSCKDSPENASSLRPVAADSSPATEQITPNPLAARAAGLALISAGCAVVGLAVALNVRPLLDDGVTAAAWLDAAPLAVATVAFAVSPSAAAWLWRAGHRWAAVFALALALGTGAVSASNVVGSQYGHRLTAAADAAEADTKRAEARRPIERDAAELAALGSAAPPAPARSPDAIAAEISARLASRGDLEGCEAKWLPSPKARGVCIEISRLRAEMAEAVAGAMRAQRWAERRAAVEARIAAARAVVDRAGPKTANADAAAIVALAQRLGWRWSTDGVNLAKSVLVALTLEGSAAMLFLLAGAVLGRPRHSRSASGTPDTAAGPSGARAPAPIAASVPALEASETPQIRPLAGETDAAGVPAGPERDAAGDAATVSSRATVLQVLRERGGSVIGPQRSLAELFGLPKSTLHRQLRELEEAGAIRLLVTPRGTAVTLAGDVAA